MDDFKTITKGDKTWVHNFGNIEPNKERNIKYSREEGERLNKESKLPRRLYLPNISAETANKTTDILNLRTKQRYKFKNGTAIIEVHAFAGRGCLKEFEKAYKYANKYPQSGKNKADWQHCSGVAYITNGSKTFKAEVHWVQGKDDKMREAFIKEILQ